MSGRNKKLSKAEKRWQRQLRELDAEQQQRVSSSPQEDDDTSEELESVLQFKQKLLKRGEIDPARIDTGLAKRRFGVKLSEALLDVCEPLLKEAEDDPNRIRICVMLGIIGWNLACDPHYPIGDLVKNFASAVGDGSDAKGTLRMLRATIEQVKARKQIMYPEIDVLIVEHEVVEQHGSVQVNVVGAARKEHIYPQRKGLLGRIRGLMKN